MQSAAPRRAAVDSTSRSPAVRRLISAARAPRRRDHVDARRCIETLHSRAQPRSAHAGRCSRRALRSATATAQAAREPSRRRAMPPGGRLLRKEMEFERAFFAAGGRLARRRRPDRLGRHRRRLRQSAAGRTAGRRRLHAGRGDQDRDAQRRLSCSNDLQIGIGRRRACGRIWSSSAATRPTNISDIRNVEIVFKKGHGLRSGEAHRGDRRERSARSSLRHRTTVSPYLSGWSSCCSCWSSRAGSGAGGV